MSLSHYDAPNGSYTSTIPSGTKAFRKVIAGFFGYSRTEVIRDKSRCNQTRSEHCECRGIDCFTTVTAKGRKLFDWCVKVADPLGVEAVIFQHRQIGFGNPNERHRAKADHMDHVHIGLNRWAAKNLTEEMVRALLPGQEDDMAQVPQAEWNQLKEDVIEIGKKVGKIESAVYIGQSDGLPPLQLDNFVREMFKDVLEDLAEIKDKLNQP